MSGRAMGNGAETIPGHYLSPGTPYPTAPLGPPLALLKVKTEVVIFLSHYVFISLYLECALSACNYLA